MRIMRLHVLHNQLSSPVPPRWLRADDESSEGFRVREPLASFLGKLKPADAATSGVPANGVVTRGAATNGAHAAALAGQA